MFKKKICLEKACKLNNYDLVKKAIDNKYYGIIKIFDILKSRECDDIFHLVLRTFNERLKSVVSPSKYKYFEFCIKNYNKNILQYLYNNEILLIYIIDNDASGLLNILEDDDKVINIIFGYKLYQKNRNKFINFLLPQITLTVENQFNSSKEFEKFVLNFILFFFLIYGGLDFSPFKQTIVSGVKLLKSL